MGVQRNLWGNFGSGKSPIVWNKAISSTFSVLNPYDFLVTRLILRFKPSTIPDEYAFLALNQFSIKCRCLLSVLTNPHNGSSPESVTSSHHLSRNHSAQRQVV